MTMTLSVGDRVKYSSKGRKQFTLRHPDRPGVVVDVNSHEMTAGVVWDGTKTPNWIHESFLKKEGE